MWVAQKPRQARVIRKKSNSVKGLDKPRRSVRGTSHVRYNSFYRLQDSRIVAAGRSDPSSDHPANFEGGDTASTGIGEHGMHVEHHRLVNPMENTIAANTQLALAA